MEKTRINKYLAAIGIGSRRKIDDLIEQGEIFVNGERALPGIVVNEEDKIIVSGKEISAKAEKKVYYMLNKPQKVVCAVSDEREKTVVQLINDNRRIFPVGRLDMDTEGLLILTNDGDLYNKIIHPRAEVYKTYFVRCRGNLNSEKIEALKNGVELDDGITLPAIVKVFKSEEKFSELEISIREGRNRQIRRMIDKVGSRVLYLRRNSIGKLKLDRELKIGEYRELTKEELNYLYSL